AAHPATHARSASTATAHRVTCTSLQPCRPHRDLHSFPTRRSSDLLTGRINRNGDIDEIILALPPTRFSEIPNLMKMLERFHQVRSEEHTSELQSHLNLVCRLLLDKKTVTCR